MVKNKKALTILSVLALTAIVSAGCNTSTKKPNEKPAQEATTEKGSKKSDIKLDYSTDEIVALMGYDIDSMITLPKDYQNVKVEYKKPEISEKEYNENIDEDLKNYPIYEKTDKKNVEKTDSIEIKYETLIDGKAEEEEPFTAYVDLKDEEVLELNFGDDEADAGKIAKEFIGKKVGDSFEIKHHITDESSNESTSIVYKGTIQSVVKAIPVDHKSLDDEKAKRIAKEYEITKDGKICQSKNDLIEVLKSNLEDTKKLDFENDINETILHNVMDKAQFHITKKMIQEEREKTEKQLRESLKDEGMDYDEYVENMKSQIGSEFNSESWAEEELKHRYFYDALIRDLKISITEEEINDYIGGGPYEDFFSMYGSKEQFILDYARGKAEEQFVNIVRKNNGLPEQKEPELTEEIMTE